MSIGGNGGNGRPPPADNAGLRRRRIEENDADEGVAQGQAAAGAVEPTRNDNRSLREQAFSRVRNTLSSPVTVVGMIVSAVAASYALSWLFGAASGATSGALTNGSTSNLGGTPVPPPLNHSQTGRIPMQSQNRCPVPRLEDILANAGHPQQTQASTRNYQNEGARPRTGRARNSHSTSRERRHRMREAQRLAAEQAAPQQRTSLPSCPPEIVFVSPIPQTPLTPSETQRILERGSTEGLCEGSLPRLSWRPVTSLTPRFLCRDTQTQRPTTSCTITDPAQECDQGQTLEQCAGLRLRNWAESTSGVCVRAASLEKEITVILEGTGLPEERGIAPTGVEQAAFDQEIKHFCNKNVKIYSEEAPFAGASDWAKDRINFSAKPEDILQGRRSDRQAEQPANQQTDEDGEQEPTQGQSEEEGAAKEKDSID